MILIHLNIPFETKFLGLLRRPIRTNLYKIYIVSDGKKASYHYTKKVYPLERVLKNSL